MKNSVKIILAFVIGIVISGVGVYALTIASKDVSYDNTNSGSEKTNIQDAIDDLYDKANGSVKVPNTYRISLSSAAITTTSDVRQGSTTVTLPISQEIYGYTKLKVISGSYISSLKYNAGSGNIGLSVGSTVNLPSGYTSITFSLVSVAVYQANCVIELSKD